MCDMTFAGRLRGKVDQGGSMIDPPDSHVSGGQNFLVFPMPKVF